MTCWRTRRGKEKKKISTHTHTHTLPETETDGERRGSGRPQGAEITYRARGERTAGPGVSRVRVRVLLDGKRQRCCYRTGLGLPRAPPRARDSRRLCGTRSRSRPRTTTRTPTHVSAPMQTVVPRGACSARCGARVVVATPSHTHTLSLSHALTRTHTPPSPARSPSALPPFLSSFPTQPPPPRSPNDWAAAADDKDHDRSAISHPPHSRPPSAARAGTFTSAPRPRRGPRPVQ